MLLGDNMGAMETVNTRIEQKTGSPTQAAEPADCVADHVIAILQNMLPNHTRQDIHDHFRRRNLTACSDGNHTGTGGGTGSGGALSFDDFWSDVEAAQSGSDFFAFVTPFIILTGVVGNSLSLRVFTSKGMRKMSASYYLAALATSDMLVLMTYLLLDWLHRGLPRWPGGKALSLITVQGFCQAFLFCSYAFRLVSVWLIVVFTVERYIGVCRPLHRREMCTKAFARRAIGSLLLVALVVACYKPVFCEVKVTASGRRLCTFKAQFELENFALDVAYGLLITAVPFVVIAVLNTLIIRKLLQTRTRHRKSKFLAPECVVKLEFTFVLLLISTCFIALNLPYFVVWCRRLQQSVAAGDLHPAVSDAERMRGALFVTRTVFCINYCTNFFLYALTGRHFRSQLRGALGCGAPLDRRRSVAARTTQVTLTTGSPRTSICMTAQLSRRDRTAD